MDSGRSGVFGGGGGGFQADERQLEMFAGGDFPGASGAK